MSLRLLYTGILQFMASIYKLYNRNYWYQFTIQVILISEWNYCRFEQVTPGADETQTSVLEGEEEDKH
jgi:hypothetical protein